MKQLTIMATVFLPLSFIQSASTFFALGVGLEIATVAALLALFRRRGWL